MLEQTRRFFASRNVLEVDTPIVVGSPVTDVHIHSAEVRFPDVQRPYFLHTSPEYAMKRLLAAGSSDIFQICHVVRGLERGKLHNAEFTLIEWYRIGFSLDQLMKEVASLTRELLGRSVESEQLTYRDAFLRKLRLDPFAASLSELRKTARVAGFDHPAAERDELLDFLMASCVGPKLGRGSLSFVHRYPASQAALAQLDADDPRCALRFELYYEGVELANGFKELACSIEQRVRFEQDAHERRRRGLPEFPGDENLLAALEHGLPDCAGVAVGFDRVAMLATQAQHIDEVLPFPIERA
jgi:lysyl-tRNA synthetase-like protein GenX